MELFEPFLKVFVLIFLAEFGDKSQLVCMTLSARHRAFPVLIGSMLAFSALNLLAVVFGAALSLYLPKELIFAAVGVLFLVFGVQSLRAEEDDEESEVKVGRHLLASVFLLIFLAELGDKTQLSIAGLAAVEQAWVVWLAGTSALLVTTVMGVWLGKVALQSIPLLWVHRGAGVLFIAFSLIAFWQFVLFIS